MFGIGLALVPTIFYALICILNNPFLAFLWVNILNYFIMGIVRYIPSLQGGIIMDLTITFSFIVFVLYINLNNKKIEWKRSVNLLNLSILIWLLYCIAQLFNPESVSVAAWLTGVRGEAIYFFLIVLMTQLVCTKYQHMRIYVAIWSVLVLLAVMKALMQKFVGFDSGETRWLYVDGFARTHILQTSIRYFSFFTDAANFGSGMGYSMFFFSIISFVRNSLAERLYYLFVALMAGYGMMISGTRTAMVVPFAALFVYILLRKDFKKIIYMSLLLAGALIFFKYTTILNGNGEIRRMRSAFHPENDPSYLVRLANQQKMKVYMADRYFGVGIGLGGGKAKRYAPNAYMSQIATDSWFVMIWVETGIVGLLLHILTLLMILAGGAYILLFKIRDDDLRTYLIAFYAGLTGMIAASYANEIFGQLPNGFTIFTGMAFVYLGPYYDRELSEAKQNTLNHEHEYS
ncbi:MAG: O-antigen ligase family protein [Bacteroidales bacterium]